MAQKQDETENKAATPPVGDDASKAIEDLKAIIEDQNGVIERMRVDLQTSMSQHQADVGEFAKRNLSDLGKPEPRKEVQFTRQYACAGIQGPTLDTWVNQPYAVRHGDVVELPMTEVKRLNLDRKGLLITDPKKFEPVIVHTREVVKGKWEATKKTISVEDLREAKQPVGGRKL